MLRNRLLGSRRYSTLSGREALVAIAIKAWNAWREGKSLQTLSWRAEGPSAEPSGGRLNSPGMGSLRGRHAAYYARLAKLAAPQM